MLLDQLLHEGIGLCIDTELIEKAGVSKCARKYQVSSRSNDVMGPGNMR